MSPPGRASTTASNLYGRVILGLRGFTNQTVNKEPKWQHRRPELTTGYHPTTFAPR